MKRIFVLGAALLAAGLGAAGLRSRPEAVGGNPEHRDAVVSASAPATAGDDPLIVHEWGTFTTFSGSNGVRLEFRPLVDNDLPGFVVDRVLQAGYVNLLSKSRTRAHVRMETPVTYFYTQRERDVKVRVHFPKGLLTEFYPPVAAMAPKFKQEYLSTGEPIPESGGMLDWGTVHLIPPDRLRPALDDRDLAATMQQQMIDTLLPKTEQQGTEHYAYARETDSALVHVRIPLPQPNPSPADPSTLSFGGFLRGVSPGDYFEKFLFYRGVGNFELPLSLESLGDGRFRATNAGDEPIRSLFLVTVGEGSLQYRRFDSIGAGESLVLTSPDQSSDVTQLGAEVETALRNEGLYEREAKAMVKTWSSSWFGETGTRLFYLVPTQLTGELLPLSVEPQPEEVIRVLVGRMEILSQEDESRMLEIVKDSAARRATAKESKMAPPLHEELVRLGRLAEPALARIRTIARESAVRDEATRLIAELRAAVDAAAAQAAPGQSAAN